MFINVGELLLILAFLPELRPGKVLFLKSNQFMPKIDTHKVLIDGAIRYFLHCGNLFFLMSFIVSKNF